MTTYKAILTNTKQEAITLISALDNLLGYPNLETNTITYTTPRKHSNTINYIVLIPDDKATDTFFLAALAINSGLTCTVVDVDSSIDFYTITMEQMMAGYSID